MSKPTDLEVAASRLRMMARAYDLASVRADQRGGEGLRLAEEELYAAAHDYVAEASAERARAAAEWMQNGGRR